MVIIIIIEMRRDTLTGTKYIFSDIGMSPNGYITIATALQYGRHLLCVKAIFAHRGNLAAAINAMCHTGIAFNSDSGVATHQCRVAMCFHASTGAEDAAFDVGPDFCACSAYRHLGIVFHTAYLSAAIDVAIDRAAGDADSRSVGNGLFAPEGVVEAAASTEHISVLGWLIGTFKTYRAAGDADGANAGIGGSGVGVVFTDIGSGAVILLPEIIIS